MTYEADPKQKLYEAERLKTTAFFSIAISTVATLTAIIVVPMLYNYVQHVQAPLQDEVNFCVHRTETLWEQYAKVRKDSKFYFFFFFFFFFFVIKSSKPFLSFFFFFFF